MYRAFFHGIKKKEVLIVSNKGLNLGRIDISENRALFGEKIKALLDIKKRLYLVTPCRNGISGRDGPSMY